MRARPRRIASLTGEMAEVVGGQRDLVADGLADGGHVLDQAGDRLGR